MCCSEEKINPQSKKNSIKNNTASNKNAKVDNINFCKRRGKRVKQHELPQTTTNNTNDTNNNESKYEYEYEYIKQKKVMSSSKSRHNGETKSGGIESLLPSIIAVIVIGIGIIAKMGFRGRATVAGIDLGTTNSVICVQQQSKGSEVGEINCIPDPFNNSPIIPSVISFLDPKFYKKTKQYKKKDELGYALFPSPSYVLVGSAAKERIDTHPYHTLYHAKRVLGRLYDDDAVSELKHEVEFSVSQKENDDNESESESDVDSDNNYDSNVVFDVPFHSKNIKQGNNHNEMKKRNSNHHHISISPYQVGSYVVNHLMEITTQYLGHDNVRSAVIAVPAKFNADQRKDTVLAFKNIGVNVARILEEPVAAALAYGLQKKENVDFIIVYDFGGGTLDVSVLQVFEGGYVDVIGNDGDNRLGGADFDTAVAHFLLDGNDGFGSKVLNDISETLAELEKSHSTSSNNNSNDDDDDDDDNGIEERLVSECPKLADMPLCSISSFHTMGEKMKIDLSSFTDDDSVVSRECYGIPSNDTDYRPKELSDFCSMLEPIQFQMSLKQYDDVCAPLYDRSISPVSRILGDLDMTVDEIDEVVMVGGTTRMPQIRELVREALKVESLNTSIDPDLTVAYGAASVID